MKVGPLLDRLRPSSRLFPKSLARPRIVASEASLHKNIPVCTAEKNNIPRDEAGCGPEWSFWLPWLPAVFPGPEHRLRAPETVTFVTFVTSGPGILAGQKDQPVERTEGQNGT